MKGRSINQREIMVMFQILINCFMRNKKRLRFHVQDLKDFFQSQEHPLDFSMFYFLKIRPISREKVKIRYSVKKNPFKFYTRSEYIYEALEIACSLKESTKGYELFPDQKFEKIKQEFCDAIDEKLFISRTTE